MGDVHRLQGPLLSHTNTGPIQEVPTYYVPTMEFTVVANGFTQRYKNPPVCRQLVGQSLIPPNLSPAYTNSSSSVSVAGLDGKHGKIRAGLQTSL